jgi:uncharacterized membrane protein YgcG
MKKLSFVVAVAAAAAIAPASALAGTFSGIVVGKAPGSLAVAATSGAVRTIRTRAHPRIGARVVVRGASVRTTGFAHRVRIQAVIVRRASATTFLAGGRSLLAIRTGRRLASVVDTAQPGTGAVVDATAQVTSSGRLVADSAQVVGEMSKVEVQALVVSVGAGTITLSVNGQTLVLSLPAGIQLPSTLVHQTVTLTLDLTGGQPTASEANDEQGDDNDQGDDNGDQGDDTGGSGGGSGGGDGGDGGGGGD